MPPFFGVGVLVVESAGIELLVLICTQDADFVVIAAESPSTVMDRMDVQFRSVWFTRQFAEFLCKSLLEVVVKIILFAEDDNTSFRDWPMSATRSFDNDTHPSYS